MKTAIKNETKTNHRLKQTYQFHTCPLNVQCKTQNVLDISFRIKKSIHDASTSKPMVQMIWEDPALIVMIFRGHHLIQQVRSITRNRTGSHIQLMFPIQPLIGACTSAPSDQPPVPPHCGKIYCAYHVQISGLPRGPLTAQHRTAELRSGNSELSWSAKPQGT